MIYTALLPTELLGIHCASTLRLEAETLSIVGKTAVDLSSPSTHFRLPAPLVAWGDGLKPAAAAAAAAKLRKQTRSVKTCELRQNTLGLPLDRCSQLPNPSLVRS